LTCVQSGKPVIVTGPAEADEFDHHPRFNDLIARGAVVLVPRGASAEAYADAIEAARDRTSARLLFNFDGWWRDAADAVRATFALRRASESVRGSAGRTRQQET
jgi:hypothetical protein